MADATSTLDPTADLGSLLSGLGTNASLMRPLATAAASLSAWGTLIPTCAATSSNGLKAAGTEQAAVRAARAANNAQRWRGQRRRAHTIGRSSRNGTLESEKAAMFNKYMEEVCLHVHSRGRHILQMTLARSRQNHRLSPRLSVRSANAKALPCLLLGLAAALTPRAFRLRVRRSSRSLLSRQRWPNSRRQRALCAKSSRSP